MLLTLLILAVFLGVMYYLCSTFKIGKHPIHLSFLFTLFGLLSISIGVLTGVKPFYWAGLLMIAPVVLGWLKFAGDKIKADQPEHTPFKEDEFLQLKTEPQSAKSTESFSATPKEESDYVKRMKETFRQRDIMDEERRTQEERRREHEERRREHEREMRARQQKKEGNDEEPPSDDEPEPESPPTEEPPIEYGDTISVNFLDNLNLMNEKDADRIAEIEKLIRPDSV